MTQQQQHHNGERPMFEEGVPAWSGVPLKIDDSRVVVPLHVADQRPFSLVGWTPMGFLIALEGDVEYHLYRRD